MGKIRIFVLFFLLSTLTFCHQKNKIDYKYRITGWVKNNGVIKRALWYTDTICFVGNTKHFFMLDTFCVITDTGYYYNTNGSLQMIYPPYIIQNIKN